jgi:hypothetical protein
MGVACLGVWGVGDAREVWSAVLLLQSALVRSADVWYAGGSSQRAWHRVEGVAAARGRAVGDGWTWLRGFPAATVSFCCLLRELVNVIHGNVVPHRRDGK